MLIFSIFIFDNQLINSYTQKMPSSTKTNLKKLVAKNKIEEVIEELLSIHELLNEYKFYDKIIMLSSQYDFFLDEKNLGTISLADFNLEFNKIKRSLLSFINKMPDINEKEKGIKCYLNSNSQMLELKFDEVLDSFGSTQVEFNMVNISVILNVDRNNLVIRQVKTGSVYLYIEVLDSTSLISINNSNNSIQKRNLPELMVLPKIISAKLIEPSSKRNLGGIFNLKKWIRFSVILISLVGIIFLIYNFLNKELPSNFLNKESNQELTEEYESNIVSDLNKGYSVAPNNDTIKFITSFVSSDNEQVSFDNLKQIYYIFVRDNPSSNILKSDKIIKNKIVVLQETKPIFIEVFSLGKYILIPKVSFLAGQWNVIIVYSNIGNWRSNLSKDNLSNSDFILLKKSTLN